MKRARVHSKEGPEKVTKVGRRPNHLSADADGSHRRSTRWPYCGKTLSTQTSSLPLGLLLPLSRSIQDGYPAAI